MRKLITLAIALACIACKEKGGESGTTIKYITDNPDVVVTSNETVPVYEDGLGVSEDCQNGSEENEQTEEHECEETITKEGTLKVCEGEISFEGQIIVEALDPCNNETEFYWRTEDAVLHRIYSGIDGLHWVDLNHHDTVPVAHVQSVAGKVCQFLVHPDWEIEVTAMY